MKLNLTQLYQPTGLEKLGIRGIQDFRQFAFGYTNDFGLRAQLLDRTKPNVYLLHTTRQSSTKATAIRQYYKSLTV